jgi:chemotaxis protein CheC
MPDAQPLTALQLDALRELSNIGSGSASIALAGLLGRSIDISVPTAAALPLADAVTAVGDPGELRHAVVLPVDGDLAAMVVLLFPEEDAQRICAIYGLDAGTEDGRSMLAEVGNVLSANYLGVLGQMAGFALEPTPPQVACDLLGSIVETVLLASAADDDTALILDSALTVEEEACSLSFLLLAGDDGIRRILGNLGV